MYLRKFFTCLAIETVYSGDWVLGWLVAAAKRRTLETLDVSFGNAFCAFSRSKAGPAITVAMKADTYAAVCTSPVLSM